MKRLTLVLALLIIVNYDLFASVAKPPAPPVDTTIRILLVADSRLSTQNITLAKAYLTESWNNTNFNTTTPTTLTFANNGLAIPAGSSVFSGDGGDQIEKIRSFVEFPVFGTVPNLRTIYAADVVIGLSSTMEGECGRAKQINWLGFGPPPFLSGPNFQATSGPHDLRRANIDYIGVAALSGHTSCRPYLAAHEFGHLLGGGHRVSVYGQSGGLFSNSKARRTFLIWNQTYIKNVLTALGHGPETPDCTSTDPSLCVHLEKFSDFDDPSDFRNAVALRKTARSVANYRVGAGVPAPAGTCTDGIDNDGDNGVDSADQQCGVCNQEVCPTVSNPPPNCNATIPPFGIIGWVTEVCIPGTSETAYELVWAHACPEEVSFYEIWTAQPTSTPFIFDWLVIPPTTGLRIGGSPGRVKIRSCGTGGCSGLSSSSFLAVDLC